MSSGASEAKTRVVDEEKTGEARECAAQDRDR